MTISNNPKLIFVHVHRTGGTTINNLLKQALGAEVEIRGEHVDISASETIILEKLVEYTVFGFVRNPWDRLLSWYSLINSQNQKSLKVERQKFEEFLELDQAFQQGDTFFHYNQLDYFPTKDGAIDFIKLFHYENFEEEVKNLFSLLKLTLKEIPVINNTKKKQYRDYYTDRSIELIQQKCRKDIDFFNYSF